MGHQAGQGPKQGVGGLGGNGACAVVGSGAAAPGPLLSERGCPCTAAAGPLLLGCLGTDGDTWAWMCLTFLP